MEELLEIMVKGLVEDKDAVVVRVENSNQGEDVNPKERVDKIYHVNVAKEDMGRVIGKQGRIAKAIRVVMRAGATRINEKILVEIDQQA